MNLLNVLIIGSGGREHALAWAMARTPQVQQVYVAPGNAGTTWPAAVGRAAATNVPLKVDDLAGLRAFAQEQAIDLTIVGPELPLTLGIVDEFQQAGLRIFGPTKAASQLEGSKAFSKAFMQAHAIPTADFVTFRDYAAARAYVLRRSETTPAFNLVIKADGLAAGKGVFVCDTVDEAVAALHSLLVERSLGAAGDTVVIEERLSGPEVSLLAFTDGVSVVAMPPARDHKRVFDEDQGPNTGGMGAFAPAPDVDAALVETIMQTILQPAVRGMAERGTPYVGVLYAGVMLTPQGPMTLEFNCRFGDPETQVLVPLIPNLLEIFLACTEQRLDQVQSQWAAGACATVVLASPGYPGAYPTGLPITGLDALGADPDLLVFHAGTAQKNGQVVTAGGRVLAISGRGRDLPTALARAYAGVEQVHFDGMHYRKDIGRVTRFEKSGYEKSETTVQPTNAYARAGVNIAAGQQAVDLMKEAVRATYGPEVLAGIGAFGGLYNAAKLKAMAAPVLVASTDGVGTKTKVAAKLNRWDTIGRDLVNHCINDILVQGAQPLFFLDYVASSQIAPEQIATLVKGVADACREVGCALLGGETAEMPGVYQPGEIDLAGTIVGVVNRPQLIDGSRIQPGDLILGLPSTGLHTNGYSLARSILADLDWTTPHPALGCSIGDALLQVHRCYLPEVQKLWSAGVDIRGLAHITGGGITDNLPRIFPEGIGAVIRHKTWPVPPIFTLIQELGEVPDEQMLHVFNMGLGMLVIVPPAQAALAQATLPNECLIVGEIVTGQNGVRYE